MRPHRTRFSQAARKRAVLMVRDYGTGPSELAVELIAKKVGCTPAVLRGWVLRSRLDATERAAFTADERRRLKELELENRELKRRNDLLRKATALFAQAAMERRSSGS